MIVNADDLGSGSECNRAIIESLKRGYCSSTTLMANMGAFEEACALVHDHKLHNHTGIHFVLTAGAPLTHGVKRCQRFCGTEGMFTLDRRQRICWLTPFEREMLAEELRAQIDACRRNGIRLTHADAHDHAHEEWAIASVAILVCRSTGIPHVRLARNCGPGRGGLRRIYRYLINARLRRARLARTRYFGSVLDYAWLTQHRGAPKAADAVEIMIHPGYDSNGALVDKTCGLRLDQVARQWNSESPFVSFTGDRYEP